LRVLCLRKKLELVPLLQHIQNMMAEEQLWRSWILELIQVPLACRQPLMGNLR
ncbi:unnamed protein product, partial [Heterosigma akashiwo]